MRQQGGRSLLAPLAQASWACWLASCWGGMLGEVMARKGSTFGSLEQP